MAAHIVRRLLWLPILLLLVTVVTLAMARYGPGDPVQVMLGPRAPTEAAEALREELGLNDPFPIQVTRYIGKALRGDFGESYKFRNQPVGPLILRRITVSAQLSVTALLIGTALGIVLGALAGLFRNSWLDYGIISGVVLLDSMPAFAILPPLLYLVAVRWRVLPPGGWDGLFSAKAVLPLIALSIGPATVFARQTRANLLEVIGQDYIRTARAKGLRETIVVLRHALRNTLIPLTTLFGLALGGSVVGGSFFIETLLGIPGIGLLAYETFLARDYPVITALVIITAVAIAVANLAVDIAYAYIDPRMREGA
jgi:ABC-type dipeptide/oligopeptide/nickel transport system permease component